MLLAPQFQQQWRQDRKHGAGTMHLGVTAGAKRNHQLQLRDARYTVMREHLPAMAADPAGEAVPSQHVIAQPAKVLCLIVPLQCVAARAKPVRQNLHPPAPAAVKRALLWPLHPPQLRMSPRPRQSPLCFLLSGSSMPLRSKPRHGLFSVSSTLGGANAP